MRQLTLLSFVLSAVFSIAGDVAGQEAWEESWRQATEAAERQDFQAAVKHSKVAIEKGLRNPQVDYLVGRWNFRAGDAKASVVHFDVFLKKVPSRSNSLWERGISCYYADEFEAGAKQFADYQKYHDNDVENAVWRYLCQLPIDGKKKAREAILPIKNDRRVPMMEIYKLFKGELNPEDVLQALSASSAADESAKVEAMHAQLYLGLFYDSEGKQKKALEHIQLAVKQFKAGSYMWSVAVVHQAHLKKRISKVQKPNSEESVPR